MASLEKNSLSGGNKFPKTERLNSKKLIEELFSKGSSFYLYPFKLVYRKYQVSDQKAPYPQLLISVPKRNFKKAVDRNRLRRQIKEAYRLNKKTVFLEIGQEIMPLHLALIYTAKEKISFDKLEEKLILILKRLKNI